MSAPEGYLGAAGLAVALLLEREVAAAWAEPSQIFLVGQALGEPPSGPGARGSAVFMPWVGWALTLDDFLTTRTMELAVHLDDLAVSVGHPAPDLPDAAFEPVLTLLARLAARRHGQAAMLRALARSERAPAAINAI